LMKSYGATVAREGRWWMIAIPELSGLTQARRLDEVERMAREYIAVTTDVPLSQVGVEISGIEAAGQDLLEAKVLVDDLRRRASELEELVADLMRSVAASLTGADVPVRDVSNVLGVSHQRVSQLVQAAAEGESSDWAKLLRAMPAEFEQDLVVRLRDGRALRIIEVDTPRKVKNSKSRQPQRAATRETDHPIRKSAKPRTARSAARSGVAGRPTPRKVSLKNG
jgi:predicted XRE-type DNA-binding protein